MRPRFPITAPFRKTSIVTACSVPQTPSKQSRRPNCFTGAESLIKEGGLCIYKSVDVLSCRIGGNWPDLCWPQPPIPWLFSLKSKCRFPLFATLPMSTRLPLLLGSVFHILQQPITMRPGIDPANGGVLALVACRARSFPVRGNCGDTGKNFVAHLL
jgi:hypothetical protein